MQKIVLAAIATTVLASPVMASGMSCGNAPRDQWMSQEAIKAKAAGMGYQVRQVKAEGSCYEVYAIDAKGMRAEMLFNPVSGEPVGTDNDD